MGLPYKESFWLDNDISVLPPLVGETEADAVVIGGGVSDSDRRHLVAEIRNKQPSTLAIVGHGPESVLIQLRQAFKEKASSEAT